MLPQISIKQGLALYTSSPLHMNIGGIEFTNFTTVCRRLVCLCHIIFLHPLIVILQNSFISLTTRCQDQTQTDISQTGQILDRPNLDTTKPRHDQTQTGHILDTDTSQTRTYPRHGHILDTTKPRQVHVLDKDISQIISIDNQIIY